MLRMYMSEKMQPGLDCCYAAEKFFRTVMDIVVKVEDAERRCVGDENIRVFRNICIMLGLAVRDAVAHEHWDTIEFHTVNFHSGIAQVMDITVKLVNGGVHEIQRFLLAAVHGKVARMHNDVSLWQIVQPSVTAMRV